MCIDYLWNFPEENVYLITLSFNIRRTPRNRKKKKPKQYNIKMPKNTERLFTEKEMQRFQKLRKDTASFKLSKMQIKATQRFPSGWESIAEFC